MDEEYTKIENHLKFSKKLYEIDEKGRHIITSFQKKKTKSINKRTQSFLFEKDANIIYRNILYCLSMKRLKLYFYIHFYLDELLYFEAQNSSYFYIEDNTYSLSKIYFGQQEWITDSFVQKYEFYEESTVSINEAMYLICYLKEYDMILMDLEQYIKPFKNIKSIKSKLRYTIHKIRKRHREVWKVLLDIVNQHFPEKN